MVNWANRVTLARITLIPVFLITLRYAEWWVALSLFTIIAATDMLDGYVARKKKLTSRAGAVLDPLADKLLVCGALIFLMKNGIDAWVVYVIIAREFLITGLRTLTETIIVASMWGKAKTFVQMLAIGWALIGLPYLDQVMLVTVAITILSGLQYFWVARKELVDALN